jgi:hypothetical protein
MTTIERILTVAKTVFVIIGLAVGLELVAMRSLAFVTPAWRRLPGPAR